MAAHKNLNFIESIIEEDLKNGKHKKIHTRFPPEPNGYLHIGHAKSICLNFGLAKKYKGKCNLRFDDTNPEKEEIEYVESIKKDIKWLGFVWDNKAYFASDYFDQLYEWAIMLIRKGLAYVDDQPAKLISAQRTEPAKPGIESPYRHRSIEENLHLFKGMKEGEYKEGEKVLRAKIDMNSPNMHLRDPIMYRILFKYHHNTGDKWCIYPTYDYTHGQSDYLEKITHSICTLEFEVHRPLYDWFLDYIISNKYRPRQIEFARLNLSHTIMSKRKLLQLVKKKFVDGWDDPRMPTISGMRRRGYSPASIRNFAERVGIAKREHIIELEFLEHCVREDLNKTSPRVMVVLNPVKLIIDNYPEEKTEYLDAENNPESEVKSYRKLPFSKVLYIEKEDFREVGSRKFFRLALGKEVRLKNAYIIKGEYVVKNDQGEIVEIHCTYDSDSKSGSGTEASQRKIKGTLHWVSAQHAVPVTVKIYDKLFTNETPDSHQSEDFTHFINPNSLTILKNCFAEPDLSKSNPLDRFQFQRLGYFCVDKNSSEKNIVFNRTVTLRDSWTKIQQKQLNK